MLTRTRCVALLLVIGGVAHVADAHPAPFSYLDVRLSSDVLEGRLVVHATDVAHDLGLQSPAALSDIRELDKYSDAVAALLSPRLTLRVDGQDVAWQILRMQPLPEQSAVEILWRATVPARPGRLTLKALLFPYDPTHQTFVNIFDGPQLERQEVLSRERDTFDFYSGTRQGLLAVFAAFTASGIHHIAIGPDHILFIVGLLLLGGSVPRLLGIVTAFTIGHSITLAMATLGILNPPARLIEPAIALSIVYVGADNLLAGTHGRDVRPWIALFFGLVHGFGFANVLRETGLPNRALGLSLFSFNLGVEIGQAAVVIVVASALRLIRTRNAALAGRLATAGSLVVTAAGAFWFVERVL